MGMKIADYQSSKEYQEAGPYDEMTVTLKLMEVPVAHDALMEALLTNILLSNPNSVTNYDKTYKAGVAVYTEMTIRGPKYAVTPFLVFVNS